MSVKVKLPSETKDSKDIVFDIFSKLGVNSFCVNFDGSGDDGSIQDPEDFKPASKSKDAESPHTDSKLCASSNINIQLSREIFNLFLIEGSII